MYDNNKYIKIILMAILLGLFLVAPVSADAFSAWSNASGCWTATNSTHTIVMWNATGTSSWSVPSGVTNVSYLVVAGGGGSAAGPGGAGGGAGGMLESTSFAISGVVNITVGGGGAGGASAYLNGTSGQNSSFGNTTVGGLVNANGGGGGGGLGIGKDGGSGGGSSGNTLYAGGVSISGQGYDGGIGTGDGYTAGGGGGGKSQVGARGDGTRNGGGGGNSSITGILTTYAGGGGGGTNVGSDSLGGLGGGGGGKFNGLGTNGTNGLGGGGGGSGTGYAGAYGGSGIVIVQYQTPGAQPPVANFTSSMVQNLTPNMWNFNDTSTNTPTSWNWSFGDGRVASTQNATHLFATAGNYTINLTATNAVGSSTSIKYQQVYVQANYTVVFFNTTGTQNWTVPTGVTSIDYLLIAGGAGGGGNNGVGGGGGAGGLITGSSYVVTPSTNVTLVVGSGGAAQTRGTNSSIAATIIAIGGGYGGGSAAPITGGAGGSGGGGGGVGVNAGGDADYIIPRQGYDGGWGNYTASKYGAGGGGGAGEMGVNGTAAAGGNGGNGSIINITGIGSYYGGGGGGSYYTTGGIVGLGGLGGGGNASGGAGGVNGYPGVDNTGGGGGGGGNNGGSEIKTGGNGGSGTVILRYLTPSSTSPVWSYANGCWTATAGSYNYTMWNVSGTSSWSIPSGVSQADVLVVGGGGAGGAYLGGGGGAGGLRFKPNYSISGTSATIVVGAGGARQTATDYNSPHVGYSGSNSSISGSGITLLSATGGGGGSAYTPATTALSGGSGGGAGDASKSGAAGNFGGYTPDEGYTGGSSTAAYASGGGGGAGAVGANGVSGNAGGFGGNGLKNITISSVNYNFATIFGNVGVQNASDGQAWFAGGGGGGSDAASGATQGLGGNGGGGSASYNRINSGSDAINGTGSGGGGSSNNANSIGYAGGSGIVIISYLTPAVSAPVSSFTTNTTSGYAPLTVQFNDTSSNTSTSWQWNATNVTGNNTPFTFSTTQNTTGTFGVGNYTIKLNATNSGGSNVSAQTTWINVSTSTITLVPNFISNQTAGYQSPWVVQFNDTSVGNPSTWNWTFGDGRTSTSQNPMYIYHVANNYTVTLNVTNASGSLSNTTKYVELRTDDDIYLKSWSHFNSTPIVDEKGNAWSLSSAATVSTVVKKFGAGSLAIITDEDYISSASNNIWNLNATNWEMEFWYYPVSQGSASKNIISRTTGTGTGTTSGWGFRNNGSTTGYSFWMGNIANETPKFTLQNNVWTHVKIYRNNNNVEVYVNGSKVVVSTPQPGSYDIAQPITIGVKQDGADNYFYLDEFRFTRGISREVGNFTTPYAAYNGNLYMNYININPNATLRYKTNPGTGAVIYNQTGVRNRTVQIQNITNATMINGSTNYLVGNMVAVGVSLNNTVYSDMILNSYTIDDVNGAVEFSVSRPLGIKALFDNRTDLVDIRMLYYNYTEEPQVYTYFDFGSVTDGQNNVTYPITSFIGTNLTVGTWDFYPNFTSNVTTTYVGRTIQFNDTTVGYPNLWNWSWGDGTWTNGTSRNVTHSYSTNGTYNVTLLEMLYQNTSVFNSTTKTNYITVNSLVVANFTSNSTIGYSPLTVQFNDTSLGNPTSWNWTFGGANYSSLQNPVYTFTGNGMYTVRLTANTTGVTNTTVITNYITVSAAPFANFTMNVSNGYSPLAVQFNDTTSNIPTSWNWSFGDGNYSVSQNPTHVYGNIGNYTIVLNATNTFGSSNITKYAQVNGYSPSSAFVANNTYSQIPAVIQFTDQSVNSPVSWNWTFGDGTYSDSQNPLKIYSTVGIFNVTLNTSNTYGYNSMTRAYYITVVDAVPKPSFIENATAGVNPLAIQFNDTTSGGIVGWNWSFGDGYYSGDSQPIHVYTNVGTYTVTLTVVGVGGSNSTTKLNHIHLITTPFPLTDFSASPTTGVSPMNVQFTDLTSGSGVTGWNWSFGDGTYSNSQNPLKTYLTTGQYTVTLMTTNGYGSNGTSRVNYINVNIPTSYVYPAFVATPTYGTYALTPIQFTDNSVCNPSCNAWSWDFNNDGAVDSQLQNPSYVYPSAGTYSPKLIVTNGYGSGTKILQSYIQINPIYVPTTIPQPTVSWTPGYSDANGSFVFRGADMSTDIENSTYLKYWLPNFTQSGNFSLYGFGFSIMAPTMHVFGFWIFLIIWALYLFAVWVRSQDVTMPVVIGILSIGVMGVLFPKESLPVLIIMFAICIAAILTKLFKD